VTRLSADDLALELLDVQADWSLRSAAQIGEQVEQAMQSVAPPKKEVARPDIAPPLVPLADQLLGPLLAVLSHEERPSSVRASARFDTGAVVLSHDQAIYALEAGRQLRGRFLVCATLALTPCAERLGPLRWGVASRRLLEPET
jgi:hypothetical protein